MGLEQVYQTLCDFGLLLVTDARWPSVAGLVAGAPLRGSWWGHPKGRAIYRVLEQLTKHPGVLTVKLISGKVTLVHRLLWDALLAVATAHEPWQMRGLSAAALKLLDQVNRNGWLRTDSLPERGKPAVRVWGMAARELEERLLIHAEQFHTERGNHAKSLESWDRWAPRVGFEGQKMDAGTAKAKFEEIVKSFEERFGMGGQLAWTQPASRRRPSPRHTPDL